MVKWLHLVSIYGICIPCQDDWWFSLITAAGRGATDDGGVSESSIFSWKAFQAKSSATAARFNGDFQSSWNKLLIILQTCKAWIYHYVSSGLILNGMLGSMINLKNKNLKASLINFKPRPTKTMTKLNSLKHVNRR